MSKQQIQSATTEYQKIQTEMTDVIDNRQRLEAQLSENKAVKEEFGSLKPENKIYKLIGPTLILQERDEAKLNVEKRIEFISQEMQRAEQKIQELTASSEQKKQEIAQMQTPKVSQENAAA